MKYIVIEYQMGVKCEMPIIFPETLVHSLVAEAIMSTNQVTMKDAKVVAAGHINMVDFTCHGRATSFKPNVESRGEIDEKLILQMDYTGGIKEN